MTLPKAKRKYEVKKPDEVSKQFYKDSKDSLFFAEENNTIYLYNEEDGYYETLANRKFQKKMFRYVDDHIIFKSNRANDESLLRTIEFQLSMLIERSRKSAQSDYLAFDDKLLNTNTFEFEEKTKEKFCTFKIDYNTTDLSTPCPLWEKFMNEVLVFPTGETDQDLVLLTQEMMGWLLLSTLQPHKAFFLKGDGRNGKGVFVKVLSEIIPAEHRSAMSLGQLSKNESMRADLVGKKINICAEEESKYIESALFKSLIAGDEIQARYLYRQSFQLRPQTKFLFTTNEIPRFSTADTAIKERIVFIPFNRYFTPEERDPHLHDKLAKELPGIVQWALKGAERLITNNLVFTKSKQSDEMMTDFEETVSTVVSFFNDTYTAPTEENPGTFQFSQDVYNEYDVWITAEKRKALGRNKFYKQFEKIVGPRIRPDKDQPHGWNLILKQNIWSTKQSNTSMPGMPSFQ